MHEKFPEVISSGAEMKSGYLGSAVVTSLDAEQGLASKKRGLGVRRGLTVPLHGALGGGPVALIPQHNGQAHHAAWEGSRPTPPPTASALGSRRSWAVWRPVSPASAQFVQRRTRLRHEGILLR